MLHGTEEKLTGRCLTVKRYACFSCEFVEYRASEIWDIFIKENLLRGRALALGLEVRGDNDFLRLNSKTWCGHEFMTKISSFSNRFYVVIVVNDDYQMCSLS